MQKNSKNVDVRYRDKDEDEIWNKISFRRQVRHFVDAINDRLLIDKELRGEMINMI